MRTIPAPVQNLIDAFARLPGIGPKTASRLTFFLLKAPAETSLDLAQALEAMRSETSYCPECFNITLAGEEKCDICASSTRDEDLICVVEEPLDVLAIERTGAFQGSTTFCKASFRRLKASDQTRLRFFRCWSASKTAPCGK